MQRYEEIVSRIRHNGNGKQRYETLYYPSIPKRTSDIYIMSKALDRTDNLAYEYYKDSRLFWVIQRENNLPGGTFMIPPGTRIRIPYPLDLFDLEELMKEEQF